MAPTFHRATEQLVQATMLHIHASPFIFPPLVSQALERVPAEKRTFAFNNHGVLHNCKADWHVVPTKFLEDVLRERYCLYNGKDQIPLATTTSSVAYKAFHVATRTTKLRAEIGLRLSESLLIYASKDRTTVGEPAYIKKIRATAFIALLNAFIDVDAEFAKGWLANILNPLLAQNLEFPNEDFLAEASAPHDLHAANGMPSLPSRDRIFYRIESSYVDPEPVSAVHIFPQLGTAPATQGTPAPSQQAYQPAHQQALTHIHSGQKRARE